MIFFNRSLDCEDKKTECTSLCPPTNVLCAPGQQKTVTKETLPGTECICDKEICLNPTIVSDDTAGTVIDIKNNKINIKKRMTVKLQWKRTLSKNQQLYFNVPYTPPHMLHQPFLRLSKRIISMI